MLRTVLFLLGGSMLVSCATSTLSSKEKTAAFNAYITEQNLSRSIRSARFASINGPGSASNTSSYIEDLTNRI